ncbi:MULTISPECIES: hypothetical protein [Protofrankia]|uniref:hypothetical protein n=1 Tax=Protofrankia TaxID=2994361 RepID=UPI0009755891|nr:MULTISPECIES: hypothetical protein [Protofrankia]
MTNAAAQSRSGNDRVSTLVSRADGTQISIGVQPGAGIGPAAILLRIRPSLPDTDHATYLAAPEAHRLAEALTAAARAAREPGDQLRTASDDPPRPHPDNATSHEHAVTVCEGTTVFDLSWLLGGLPASARLVDFASDTDVVLIFSADGADAAADHG